MLPNKRSTKDLSEKGLNIDTEHKGDISSITYLSDYTKSIWITKRKIPGLNLRDDKTLSYSEFKEGLLKGG